MRSDNSFHLKPADTVSVRRYQLTNRREALEFSVEGEGDFAILGTVRQIDAIVAELTRERTEKLVSALRRALKMPEKSTEYEVLLTASLRDEHLAEVSTPTLSEATS